MAIKKNELYSSIWASCDKLRGGMDASQYKDYILTLLFVKYVTDKFKGVKYADITVPEGGSFDDLVALKGNKNIGEEMDKVIAKLAEAGENNLRGVIDNAHFNDEAKLGSGKEMVDKLTGLIAIFQRDEFNFKKNKASGDDILGDAYEYLMRHFATESGKSKGQFYTPAEVSRILAKVIGIDSIEERDEGYSVYDPACGSGSLLIRAADEAPFEIAIWGQEKEVTTAGLAKMNLVLHNKAAGEIRAGNTFSAPRYFEEDSDDEVLKRFDFAVANPPFSLKNWTDGLKDYGRFDGYGDRPPEKNGDFAWLLHILKSLKSTGKAAVILPHGVLFRGNAEATIRKAIIDKGYIKGIIGLPANLFYGTGIPACIIIIDKADAAERKGNSLLKGFIRRREIYLDTNVIFRALGINGVSRQNVVTTFLRKCKQAKLKLLISHSTRTEFFDTIGYYVSQMEHYPRGDIYFGAYEEIADYSIFAFYESWRQEHAQMSLKYFVTHIKSLYLKLIKDFGIEDDVKIPGTIYHSGEFKNVRNSYSASIKSVKQGIKADYLADDYHYSNRDSHDATVVRYIELLREKSADKDIFLASSDRALRLWDMNRLDGEYPVVVYPSQLFLILLKTCGRSDNDYDSFVSFINIRPSSKRVSPENAHIILSGISSITEDISAQEHLVEAVFSDDFQNVIKNSTSDMDLYEKVQRISQNYLDEELRKKEATIVALQEDVSRYGIEGKALQDKIDEKDAALTESNRTIQRKDEEIKKKQDRILSHAERKAQPKYIAKTYVIPVLLVLLVLTFVLFILLQFIYKDEKWNFAVAFFDWARATYFGTYVGDCIYAIDLALAAIVGWMLKKWMVNPFKKELNELRKMELVQRYIKENHLD